MGFCCLMNERKIVTQQESDSKKKEAKEGGIKLHNSHHHHHHSHHLPAGRVGNRLSNRGAMPEREIDKSLWGRFFFCESVYLLCSKLPETSQAHMHATRLRVFNMTRSYLLDGGWTHQQYIFFFRERYMMMNTIRLCITSYGLYSTTDWHHDLLHFCGSLCVLASITSYYILPILQKSKSYFE